MESGRTSGEVEPMSAGTALCFGVSNNPAYDYTDTKTLATADRPIQVIVTSFVGYLAAAAGSYNMNDKLYVGTDGKLTSTTVGPVRARYIGDDSVTVHADGFLGPCIVTLPEDKTSTTDIGWGPTA